MKKVILFLFYFICSTTLDAQTLFQSSIEGILPATWGGQFNFARQTRDYGYIAAGSMGVDVDKSEFFLAKTDSNGHFLWSKITGFWYFCYVTEIEQTSDGGYILCGTCYDRTAFDYFILVSKVDSLGNEIWSKTYGGSGFDFANSIKQTYDKGFILTGNTNIGSVAADLLITKLDTVGNILWSKSYGNLSRENGHSIIQTSDSGFIVSGYADLFGIGTNLMLLKTDSLGNVLWCKGYSNCYEDWDSDIKQTYDGGYIIAEIHGIWGGPNNFSFLIKTDQNGDTLWSRTFGGIDTLRINSVLQSTDSGYVLAGEVNPIGPGQGYAYLMKCDQSGDTLWTKTFSGENQSSAYANSVSKTIDGGYILGGKTLEGGGYLIKTDSNGNGLCNQGNYPVEVQIQPFTVSNIIPPSVTSSITITGSNYGTSNCDTLIHYLCSSTSTDEIRYISLDFALSPNPASSQFTISSWQYPIKELEIFNMMGENIYSAAANSEHYTVNCEQWPEGIYFVVAVDENGNKITEMISVIR